MTRQNTGLLFGSFNPIHVGHLSIANYIAEYHGLDEVWFVVTPQNPLKAAGDLADARHRLAMTRLALEPYHRFKVRFCAQPAYTIDTLNTLRDKYPGRQFYLLMGADNWQQLPRWKDYEQLLAHYPILVYPRFGYEASVPAEKYPDVRLTAAPRMEVSASFIREAIGQHKAVACFTPLAVWRYIEAHRLYGF